jgi:predicted PurR-regulated permease PerM
MPQVAADSLGTVEGREPQSGDLVADRTPVSAPPAETVPAQSAPPFAPPEPSARRHRLSRPLWILVMLAIAFVLHVAADLLFPIVLAAMIALLLSPAVKGLARIRIPEPLGAAIVVALALAVLAVLSANLYAPVQRWLDSGPQQFRKLESKLRILKQPVKAVQEATDKVAKMAAVEPSPAPRPVAVERRSTWDFLLGTQTVLFTALTTVLLVYFLLASGDLFLRKMVKVLPRLRDKIRAVEISREIQREIGRYYVTITLINAGLGVATGFAMWLLGMPTPVLWGVAVALLNFLPYVGPLIAVVLLSAVALLTFDGALQILAPPAAFLVLNLIEDQLVQPLILGRRFAMNPVVIFVWVIAWSWLWGVGGVLIAVPVLVAVKICAERVDAMAPLAGVIGRD